ncbi:hypothetical protein OEZ85_004283 [Tetradesmus obliquus]|uniref:Uncharacterized protein n=1 Tax=Tetradesmus obliquus TaxID=3088 RepID=A0ABY8UNP6_TETOB|nr:hypothetical protein OEZ85_004283 [Tetradesmus obliquus]
MSSRPLQLAAMHAAMHGWPPQALAALLQHMAAHFRLELLLLLAKPLLLALQAGHAAAAEAMLLVLQQEACTEQPEVLRDVLLLLANQGQSEYVAWVLKVAPTVLVKLGQAAAAAALEGGYPLRPGAPADMLSRFVVNPYLATAHPAEYLGAEVRPSLPAVFMPCKKGLMLLFRRLAAAQQLPPGARVKDAALYKLMVRVVLQACSVDLLGAFLGFMEAHGEAMLEEQPRVLEEIEGTAW